MKIEEPYYEVISTVFGGMGIVWWKSISGPRVLQTILDKGQEPVEKIIHKSYPNAQQLTSPVIIELGNKIKCYLKGEVVIFDLGMIALEVCGAFQQKVLLAEYGIPRGWVSTYGRIAKYVGVMKGSRAVGRALAENPFPIIIPCHRAVRADGEIGGYQGGKEMKRALLKMEGVNFTVMGKVSMQKVHY
ncbi:MAG: MGMT family protein [Dehalococcoidales bacterium]|jgi:methylated-DNA-[protein]-cysteine S-methyltransferase